MKMEPRASRPPDRRGKEHEGIARSIPSPAIATLEGGGAHAKFEDAVSGLPPRFQGQNAAGLPHSAWMLVEHIRIAQWDILEFSRNPKHVSPKWPEGYWPCGSSSERGRVDNSIKKCRKDLKAMCDLVANPKTDLFAESPGEAAKLSCAKPC